MSDQQPPATRRDRPARRCHRRLAVRSYRQGDAHTIELVGELDIEGSPLARRAVSDALEGAAHRIVLDLAGLTFMDSSGVHMIVEAQRRLGDAHRELVIARSPRQVLRVLELCGLTRVLHLSDSSRSSIAAEHARQLRLTQAAMAAAVRAMRSLDRQRLRPPR